MPSFKLNPNPLFLSLSLYTQSISKFQRAIASMNSRCKNCSIATGVVCDILLPSKHENQQIDIQQLKMDKNGKQSNDICNKNDSLIQREDDKTTGMFSKSWARNSRCIIM